MLILPFLIAVVGSMSQPKKDLAHEVIQHGELSQNDSEITLLINSTYEIIESLETNSTDLDNKEEVNENSKSTKRPPSRFHKMRPSMKEAACKKYSTKEKYLLLEGIGSRNQMLMADSPDEASRGFTHTFASEGQDDDGDMVSIKANGEKKYDPNECDEKCQLIKKTLIEATAQSKMRAVMSAVWSDPGQPEVDEGFVSAGCFLESFIPIGNCTELGEEASWGYEHLCSECRGVYMMSKNCFPKFLNAVQCNNKELGCIFDTFSIKAHGVCQMQTLVLNVLRNKGDNTCEDWVVEQIELPVACQCRLSKSSWLRTSPVKEL